MSDVALSSGGVRVGGLEARMKKEALW